ncbi:MAG: glycoside hydrolase family 13 protein [Sedimentibacter sp.]
MFIFDSQSEFYRSPQGGIEENKLITLKIYVKKSITQPKLKIEKRYDYSSQLYKEIPMKWINAEKSYDLYTADFSINKAGHYFFSFILDENNQSNLYELLIYKENFTTPEWIKGGIIYHIFVDRFYREKILKKSEDIVIRNDWGGIPNFLPIDGEIKNNDFFGGNLEGITKKLPYLAGFGVTAIYLSPIFEAYSNHKYDVGDYFSIDPMFGDEYTFNELCKKAASYGMNIILDGVFNHTGIISRYFNKNGYYKSIGAYQSKESPYYDWYLFNHWNEDYVSWWGIKTLPTINKESTDYIEFITGNQGVLNYWQKRGVRGWRLDVADELPNEFLEKIRCAVKSQDNEAFIVGEVWEDASNKFSYGKLKEYFCGSQLDSVTNYPLKNAIIEYVKTKDCSLLNQTINYIIEKYPPQTVNCMMNILGTHDTARILTVLGSSKTPQSKSEKSIYKLSLKELKKGIKLLKIASLLQFTLPGVPCIYYGDEAGIEGFEDPFNRACFPWGNENLEILKHYKFLSQLRKNKLFIEGKYKCIIHDKGVFVFERYENEEKIIVAINLSEDTTTLNLKETMKNFITENTENKLEINSEEYLILKI